MTLTERAVFVGAAAAGAALAAAALTVIGPRLINHLGRRRPGPYVVMTEQDYAAVTTRRSQDIAD